MSVPEQVSYGWPLFDRIVPELDWRPSWLIAGPAMPYSCPEDCDHCAAVRLAEADDQRAALRAAGFS
ncbi:MAG: hypothetical protein ACRCZP_01950 [Phycicoccus sp.]